MKNLDDLRNEIDIIDNELVMLFEKRMKTVLEVAEFKRQNHLPVLNESRENAVVGKCVSRLEDHTLDSLLERWIRYTMSLSRELQERELKEQ